MGEGLAGWGQGGAGMSFVLVDNLQVLRTKCLKQNRGLNFQH